MGLLFGRLVFRNLPLIGEGLVWSVGNGTCVRLGEHPWVGYGLEYIILGHIIQHLRDRGYYKLSEIVDLRNTSIWSWGWLIARRIGFKYEAYHAWRNFLDRLKPSHVRIKNLKDKHL
jgi:hypothetical protein